MTRAPDLDRPGAEVWVKRDDQSSALYGGGKVRKLEWLLASPPFAGTQPIVSIGGIGSHHLLALALFLHRLGRRLHALTFDQVVTPHVETNLATLLAHGAELWSVRRRAGLPGAWLAYHLWARPERPGVSMAPGASTGLGGFGFVVAGLELADQIARGLVPKPATIYITGGSAGSSAGLAVGLALAGIDTHLRIVAAVERWAFNSFLFQRMIASVTTTLAAHGLDPTRLRHGPRGLLADAGVRWSIDPRQVGPGYAVPTAAGRRAIDLAAAQGLHLEPTYTGKCLAALLGGAEADPELPRGPVLLWNTHGPNDLRRYITPGWEERLPPGLRRRYATIPRSP